MKIEKLLDFKDVIDYPSEHGDTLLLIAVKRNDVKTVKKLIELGANLNIENDWHENILTLAHKLKDKHLIDKYFPQFKDNILAATKNRFLGKLTNKEVEKYSTLYEITNDELRLFQALNKDYFDEVKSLLQKGINPNIKNEEHQLLLSELSRKSITKRLKALACFKDLPTPVDFLSKYKSRKTVLESITADYKNRSNKVILYLIKHFGVDNFMQSKAHQNAFNFCEHEDDIYEKHFLNFITKENYKTISWSSLADSNNHILSERYMNKIISKILSNNWSLDYRIEKSPLIVYLTKINHEYLHNSYYSNYHKSMGINQVIEKMLSKFDLNHEYEKGTPLYHTLLEQFINFDISKIDVNKVDKNGNAALHIFLKDLGNNFLLSEHFTNYSKSYFEIVLNHPNTDIYKLNQKGKSFVSELISYINYETQAIKNCMTGKDRDNLKQILKDCLKIKGYEPEHPIKNQTLEESLHEIFKYDDTYLIELEASKLNANLEKSTSNAKKMKI